ncbi:unnamed protein product [Mycena citricolor]|uniref:DDE Tnp4 domain-containing protein n=1 Tax=Mycena citricolor TaxID=2018698 RepID=A0AAD2GZM0_9AGAR|nr:unnamed protein product [Mycena citricolor]
MTRRGSRHQASRPRPLPALSHAEQQRRAAAAAALQRRKTVLTAVTRILAVYSMALCLAAPDPIPIRTSSLNGQGWLDEIFHGHVERFLSQMGLAKEAFRRLSYELQITYGLHATKHVTADEKLATFLYFARTGSSSRLLQERFQRSAETIHNSIYTVLNILVGPFYMKYVHLPPNETPPEIKADPKLYPYFRQARGAIDGSHFHAWVRDSVSGQYRNRKGFIGQNVLAACNFAMLFVYILSGWEGSAADSAIYAYARDHDFAVPAGMYFLADAGFPLCDVLMTPYHYHAVRYHLREWGTAGQRPQNREELFNLRHAQARNVVERIFGILKRRWMVFQRAPEYPIEMQAKLVPAIAALHNFIRIHEPLDDFSAPQQPAASSVPLSRSTSSIDSFMQDEPRDILPEELGMEISAAECRRAELRRDTIAQKMWEDYQRILRERGQQ